METIRTVSEAEVEFLSLVKRASQGEVITIMDDGIPLAQVGPPVALLADPLTGAEIARRWASRKDRLSPEEAEAFEVDVNEFRAMQGYPVDRWED